MQVKRLFVTITVLFNFLLSSLSLAQGNRPIDFPDTVLRAKIAEALGKRKRDLAKDGSTATTAQCGFYRGACPANPF